MSEEIHHECGIALLRLLKPLEFYLAKYGTSMWALNKMYLLMEKQHNRGQDGAGIANIKFDVPPGQKFLNRTRSNSVNAIPEIFKEIYFGINKKCENDKERLSDVNWLKEHAEFTGELFLGHLRYGTFGKNSLFAVHPLIRENNWLTKNIALAGNFNLTNVDELFETLLNIGQHPVETSDTVTVIEKIGHFLDEEVENLYARFKNEGYSKKEITQHIITNLNLQNVLSNSCKYWDGGYTIAGILGHGDAFVMRDPSGIRPAFYYKNDEIVVVTSERPVIQTSFNAPFQEIKEIKPGYALIIRKDGSTKEYLCKQPLEKKSCSFERIYFSRGSDYEIYRERKKLGMLLAPSILKAIDFDIKHSVFSYIPNTASAAFYGLHEELNLFCDKIKKERILHLAKSLNEENLKEILELKVRIEKVAVKDVKLRTFITDDDQRNDLAAHVYDITYGTLRSGVDNLVVIDDSIVRGTTLKQSIINILDRLGPKKIVIASSAPQIRYPDCYGIDMTRLTEFIAFKAAIELLKDTKQSYIINEVYNKSKAQEKLPKEEIVNYVKEIYMPFTDEQISEKITSLLTPENINAKIEIIFQKIDDLHEAIPDNKGDWYFTGDYPTPGGNKVANTAFINYIEGKKHRVYEMQNFSE